MAALTPLNIGWRRLAPGDDYARLIQIPGIEWTFRDGSNVYRTPETVRQDLDAGVEPEKTVFGSTITVIR